VPSGSRIGVGSLPGNTFEPAVAALPEEKAGRREYLSRNSIIAHVNCYIKVSTQ